MKKYFFVSFKSFSEKRYVGCGGFVVVCSCCFARILGAIINYCNMFAPETNKIDEVCVTALTVLDKQTAAQLSDNFTDGALIIDDGEKEEEKNAPFIERWVARDKDGTLCLYFGEKPEKCNTIWDDYEDSFTDELLSQTQIICKEVYDETSKDIT